MSNEQLKDTVSDAYVKVFLYVEQDDGSVDVESLWAVPEGAGYRLDNIQFLARGVACSDVVTATPELDRGLRFTGLLAASGNSTVRIVLADLTDVKGVRDELRAMGCRSELFRTTLIAVDVPPNVPYASVRAWLERGERAGTFEYEEGCLGQPEVNL